MSKSINDSDQVVKRLAGLVQNPLTSDFCVILEDCNARIPVHSQILSSSSPYFSSLFFGPYVEGSSRELRISDVDKETFVLLLQYMYTGQLEVNLQQIGKLIQASERFLVSNAVSSLIHVANEYIEELDSSEMSFRTITGLMLEAHSLNNERLAEVCFEFIDQNTEAYLQSDAVLELPEAVMAELIQRDTLFDGLNEISLYLACLRWARGYGNLDSSVLDNFDLSSIPSTKLNSLKSLVKHIRLSYIDPGFIINQISKTHLFSYKTLYKSLALHLSPSSSPSQSKKKYNQRIGSKKPWFWSEDLHGNNILISSDRTLAIAHHHNWEKVLGNTIWYAGVHTFKVQIDLNISVSSNLWQIIVGVASPQTSLDEHLGSGPHEWGLACYSGHKIYCNDKREEYSAGCVKGDVIQVKLDLHRKSLEYFKNGESLGIAFCNLNGPVSPAVSLLKGQRVKLIWD